MERERERERGIKTRRYVERDRKRYRESREGKSGVESSAVRAV